MSSRRSRSRHLQSSGGSGINEDQIAALVSKLHQLVPELRRRRNSDKASANRVLQETCNYIRSLHREVDDLSDRLSQLLASTDDDSVEASSSAATSDDRGSSAPLPPAVGPSFDALQSVPTSSRPSDRRQKPNVRLQDYICNSAPKTPSSSAPPTVTSLSSVK
ncbi:hypothetical protein V2J09_019983 [Rumex salicifolius]